METTRLKLLGVAMSRSVVLIQLGSVDVYGPCCHQGSCKPSVEQCLDILRLDIHGGELVPLPTMGVRELLTPQRQWSQHPTEQLSYHPDTHPGLGVGTLQHLSSLHPAAAREGTGPEES